MFAELINQIAKESREEFGPYRPRPSSAGPEKCIRSLTYSALGVPPAPMPGRAVLRMDDSKWHEVLTRDWFARSVYKLHSDQMAIEFPAPGLNKKEYICDQCEKAVLPECLHGHLDWLALEPLGQDWLVEHKAIDHFRFQQYAADKARPLDNLTQTCCYSKGLQLLQVGLDRINVLFKNKNTAQYLEFLGRYDPDTDTATITERIESYGDAPAIRTKIDWTEKNIVENALVKFREVEQFRESKAVPPRPYPFDTEFPCGYCDHAGTCWDGYIAQLPNLEENAELGEELAIAIRYRQELSAGSNKDKKDIDKISAQIKLVLDNKKAKSGRAGEYSIELIPYQRTEYIAALIPPSAITKNNHVKLKIVNLNEIKKGKLKGAKK